MKYVVQTVLLITLAVCGCKSGRTVDGKWNVTPSEGMPLGATITMNFSSGNHMAVAMEIPRDIPTTGKIMLHGVLTGTYTLEGDQMGLHADDAKFTATGGPADKMAALDPYLKPGAETVKKVMNAEGKAKLTWLTDDSFTLAGKTGKAQTFTRVK